MTTPQSIQRIANRYLEATAALIDVQRKTSPEVLARGIADRLLSGKGSGGTIFLKDSKDLVSAKDAKEMEHHLKYNLTQEYGAYISEKYEDYDNTPELRRETDARVDIVDKTKVKFEAVTSPRTGIRGWRVTTNFFDLWEAAEKREERF